MLKMAVLDRQEGVEKKKPPSTRRTAADGGNGKVEVSPILCSWQEAARSQQQAISASKCSVGASFACDSNDFNDFTNSPYALRLACPA